MSKKTLGILTFNRASNYGAVLQAYALKEVCENLGYEVHVINYIKGVKDDRPTPMKDFLADSNKKNACIKLCRNLLSYVGDKKRWDAFVNFRKRYLSESNICINEKDIAALGYDVYIIGSDQIWNYNITGGTFDPVYFGDFSTDAKCIVYAASSHDTPFPLSKELEFKSMLEHTNAEIAIREKKLADYVSELTGTSYPVVIDPTLLAGREAMEKLINDNALERPYILIYQIDANPASDIAVKTLEQKFGCNVFTMTVPRIGSIHGRKGKYGPEEFLALLKNAEFLVTNSFHGIALSLLFEKQFFVYENGGVMSRIDSLLTTLSLNDRKVKMVADINIDNRIDYQPVKKILTELRQASRDYLKDALIGKKCSHLSIIEETFQLSPMNIRKKEECSGCSACVEICPVNAISMMDDEEGFLYPEINKKLCIHCGLCDQVCGFIPSKKSRIEYELPKAFGIKHKDKNTRITSRSGAAFIGFSDIILEKSGVIYGAAMMDDYSVHHIRAVTRVERNHMKNAKYVQSGMSQIYDQVISDLKDGKQVLFSGTPCQVSGLYSLLDAKNIDKTNLVSCDLVCHGVPSPKVWKDYLHYIENKYGETIQMANFRDKTFGWDSHCESFVLASGKKVVSRDYTDLFYEHIMLRPSCHKCHFANVNRVADLTLADFWGIEKNDPMFDDNKGVSLVLVNSKKGADLLETAKNSLEWLECDIKNCIQPTLVKPSVASARREAFFEDYKCMEFSQLLKKYTTPLSAIPRVKRGLKGIMYHMGIRKHP